MLPRSFYWSRGGKLSCFPQGGRVANCLPAALQESRLGKSSYLSVSVTQGEHTPPRPRFIFTCEVVPSYRSHWSKEAVIFILFFCCVFLLKTVNFQLTRVFLRHSTALNFSSDDSCVPVSPLDVHDSSSHLPFVLRSHLSALISLRLIFPSSSFFSSASKILRIL